MAKKINIITLGCSKNTVDSEHLAAQLAAMDYKIVFDSDRTDADVVVIVLVAGREGEHCGRHKEQHGDYYDIMVHNFNVLIVIVFLIVSAIKICTLI